MQILLQMCSEKAKLRMLNKVTRYIICNEEQMTCLPMHGDIYLLIY